MRIAWYWPAYNRRLDPEVALMALREQKWATENGHEMVPFWYSCASIPVAFNVGINDAYAQRCDYLMFNTVDCFTTYDGLLEKLLGILDEHDASAVGVPCMLRNQRINVEMPAYPGKVHEGIVCNAIMLMDLKKLDSLPRPWFVDIMAEDGLSREVSQDIYFARLMRDNGHKVMVDFTTPTINIGPAYIPTEELITHADKVRMVPPPEAV